MHAGHRVWTFFFVALESPTLAQVLGAVTLLHGGFRFGLQYGPPTRPSHPIAPRPALRRARGRLSGETAGFWACSAALSVRPLACYRACSSPANKSARLRGWAPKGERCRAAIPHGHWKTITFVGGLTLTGFIAPMLLDGPMNGECFLAWVEQMLAPTLQPSHVVVMDNLPAHKVAGGRQAIEARGAKLLYLPPYSPDFNPIENAFAKFKALVRKVAARTFDALETAAANTLQQFKPGECPRRVWLGLRGICSREGEVVWEYVNPFFGKPFFGGPPNSESNQVFRAVRYGRRRSPGLEARVERRPAKAMRSHRRRSTPLQLTRDRL